MPILLYGWTAWTLTKRIEKKLDGNYTRMLQAILNKSKRQQPTKHQLYGHLPPIMKTIQVRRIRHVEHCWRSKDDLISDILMWTPSHGRAKAGQPARTYIKQLSADTGYSLEDLPGAMDSRDRWWERVREIRAGSMTWWWCINFWIAKYSYWDCRIHWLHLCRRVRALPYEFPEYDTKQSDGEAPVMLELWGMWSTLSLPLLPGLLWPG